MSAQLEHWKHLLRVDDSREHKGPAMASGGCFASFGERGCPCCDAHADLAADVPEMLAEIERLHRLIVQAASHVTPGLENRPIEIVSEELPYSCRLIVQSEQEYREQAEQTRVQE